MKNYYQKIDDLNNLKQSKQHTLNVHALTMKFD